MLGTGPVGPIAYDIQRLVNAIELAFSEGHYPNNALLYLLSSEGITALPFNEVYELSKRLVSNKWTDQQYELLKVVAVCLLQDPTGLSSRDRNVLSQAFDDVLSSDIKKQKTAFDFFSASRDIKNVQKEIVKEKDKKQSKNKT
ncbi:hypothetical protein J2S30_003308 [Herbaspirillum rubrisubalbicans]|uniref:hypothetical protein n=1 Tax=Herbaspirillum rubrisubalbicans TaxID=80842 RepID=UPI0020A07C49|nr:hypothetical protein [Herbaspirillum rubrisubalbicans]MCP1574929.1 hypothetical protein [Herbaspirillum rubrisubalbicans]